MLHLVRVYASSLAVSSEEDGIHYKTFRSEVLIMSMSKRGDSAYTRSNTRPGIMALITISIATGDIEAIRAMCAVPIAAYKGIVEVEPQITCVSFITNDPFIAAHDAVRFCTHVGRLAVEDGGGHVPILFTVIQPTAPAMKVISGMVLGGDAGSAGRHFESVKESESNKRNFNA
ncbi:hypothetical protein IL306_003357 [Fusarium sp. DS 682]|nr:hypothetical protein IL306_003357 [Fusarium sp. DS 682]